MRSAIAALALAAVACTNDPSPPPDPVAAPDPCSLVSEEEVETAYGADLAAGSTETIEGIGELCAYEGDGGRATIVIRSNPRTVESLRAEDAPGEVIEGIGDAAFSYELTGDIAVIVDGVEFTVGVFPGMRPSREKTEQLAALVATRI